MRFDRLSASYPVHSAAKENKVKRYSTKLSFVGRFVQIFPDIGYSPGMKSFLGRKHDNYVRAPSSEPEPRSRSRNEFKIRIITTGLAVVFSGIP